MSAALGEDGRDLPTGLLTFCLTDMVGSTALWDRHPHVMASVVARHDALVEDAVIRHDGHLIQQQGEGDSTLSVFSRPANAVRATVDIHAAIANEAWPPGIEVVVRAAVHVGTADVRGGRYFGATLNRAARLRGLASGGQTVVSLATAELVREDLPADTELRDVGRYELRGLARAEQVFLLVPAGTSTDPPLATARLQHAEAAAIPVAATTFVGRDRDLAALGGELARHRLVTIAGPGGSGKTRLALEIAQLARRANAETELIFVDLAAVVDPARVPQAVGVAADMQTTGDAPPEEAIVRIGEVLAPRACLIVLDNCEHVSEWAARVAHAILVSGAKARVLATSQVPLGVAGERVYPLRSLEMPPDDAADAASARETDAVRLFVDRAHDHDATFELAESDVAAVGAICRALDGMPLAIELAAAHVRMLSPNEILSRLKLEPLDLLNKGPATVIERQRTLRASIEWSVQLLTEQQAFLLARLAVFNGGFTLAAVEAVCATEELPPDEIFGVLASLVERSLVARRTRGGATRYWLLDTIRRYATEQLASTGSARVRGWVLRREGKLWAIAGESREVRFRDGTGIRYLARLVARPGIEMHVLDLVASEKGATSLHEAGLPVLDDKARRAYRQRLQDLRADVDDAETSNDLAAERAEAEIHALTRELAGGIGLGGRGRTTGGSVERARVSATKAIGRAIDQIRESAPDAGEHLHQTIRTGAYCRYQPGDTPAMRVEGL